MKKIISLTLIASFLFSVLPATRADEGMWTFDNPPLKQWKERYNFEPGKEWLERLRLSSVRLADVGTTTGGASGAFVSPDGLVMTNQHVGSGQIGKLSTKERDITRDGFYARTHGEELKCPDFEVSVLVSFEDVTRRVQGAVKQGANPAVAAEQRKSEIAAVERESDAKTGLRSQVVTLYSGGEYWLYRFKKYQDVRLVFAPEEQIAFFGGDYDNFTFPRYNLDVTFFRVYENGQPLKTENYLKWSKTGAMENDFVVVSGFPGSTNRLLTTAQLKYQRDVGNPLQMEVWRVRRDALTRYASLGAEQARRAQSARRSLDNSMKRLTGQIEGLGVASSFARKEAEERELLDAIAKRAEWQSEFAPAWRQVADAYSGLPAMAKRIAYTNVVPSRLATIASQIVRYAEQIAKPNDQRTDEFRDNRLDALRLNLLSPAPVYVEMEEFLLAAWLEDARKALGETDPFIRAALDGQSPSEVAKRVIQGTKLTDVSARKALLDGGADTINRSDDPLIAFARRIEPVIREVNAWNESKIRSVETDAGQRIAQARFAVYGKTVYPDATSTLRIGYGTVRGYEEDTTLVPFKTTFHGLYERAAAFDGKHPFDLPARWREGRSKLELSTPFNFVYTGDTIGGNSGSPLVNRDAEIVGLNFDSNIQKLPNRYWYVDEKEGGRAIAVHSAAIIEALRKMYDAGKLADELIGR